MGTAGKITLSVIKADVGGWVGPSTCHPEMLALARKIVQGAVARGLLLDGQVLAAAASSQKPGLIAGRYVGKDAPVMIIRCQSGFPAVGEVLSPSPFPTCGGLDAGLPSRPADARGL